MIILYASILVIAIGLTLCFINNRILEKNYQDAKKAFTPNEVYHYLKLTAEENKELIEYIEKLKQ